MANVNKQSFVSVLQAAKAGLVKNLTGKTIMLDGKLWKVNDLVAEIQHVIDLINGTAVARTAWRQGVTDEKSAKAAIVPTMTALRSFLAAQYGVGSTMYTDCGFVARKKATMTNDVVTTRIQKNLATRKARNTMGKKQRLKVKGVVQPATTQPAATSPSTSTPPAAPLAAPAAAPSVALPNGSGSNGQSH